eukprot:gene5404-7491_t
MIDTDDFSFGGLTDDECILSAWNSDDLFSFSDEGSSEESFDLAYQIIPPLIQDPIIISEVVDHKISTVDTFISNPKRKYSAVNISKKESNKPNIRRKNKTRKSNNNISPIEWKTVDEININNNVVEISDLINSTISNGVDSISSSANANDLKRERFKAFEPLIESFNCGDTKQIADFVESKCVSDVILHSQLLKEDHFGIKPILLFWLLLHEIYPDSIIQILKTGLVSSAAGGDSCVEYVYKFTGTRISDQSVALMFTTMIESGKLNECSELSTLASRCVQDYGGLSKSVKPHTVNFIVETMITYNNDNKIIKWSCRIVLSQEK